MTSKYSWRVQNSKAWPYGQGHQPPNAAIFVLLPRPKATLPSWPDMIPYNPYLWALMRGFNFLSFQSKAKHKACSLNQSQNMSYIYFLEKGLPFIIKQERKP